jgi:hypothetical protein
MGEIRVVYEIYVMKPEGKRKRRRPRYRCDDSIKMDIKEFGCDGMNLIDLAQVRLRRRAHVNAVMKYRVY